MGPLRLRAAGLGATAMLLLWVAGAGGAAAATPLPRRGRVGQSGKRPPEVASCRQSPSGEAAQNLLGASEMLLSTLRPTCAFHAGCSQQ